MDVCLLWVLCVDR